MNRLIAILVVATLLTCGQESDDQPAQDCAVFCVVLPSNIQYYCPEEVIKDCSESSIKDCQAWWTGQAWSVQCDVVKSKGLIIYDLREKP